MSYYSRRERGTQIFCVQRKTVNGRASERSSGEREQGIRERASLRVLDVSVCMYVCFMRGRIRYWEEQSAGFISDIENKFVGSSFRGSEQYRGRVHRCSLMD